MFRSILILSACFAFANAASAQTWDAKADFSATQNPTGAWSYAYSTNLAGPLTLYPAVYSVDNGYDWSFANNPSAVPHVSYYPPSTPYDNIPPDCMLLHPGPQNQFSHCVWTAPAAGVYNIQASFTSLANGGPHGYVLENGTSIGDSDLVEGVAQNYSFASVPLAAGDTIDAAVGVGVDNNYDGDETEFSLTITAITSGPPVPGAYRGLVTGTSGVPEGIVSANVNGIGQFTGRLVVGKMQHAVKGNFTTMGNYSTTLTLANGNTIPLGLNFILNGTLTGTGAYEGNAFSLSAGPISNTSSAGGKYTFAIAPGQSLESGSAPQGTGFGYMNVRRNGEVWIAGSLGDGKQFAASSWITSGSSVPIYVNKYKTGGVGGTLVFQNTDSTDCNGTLYWLKPETTSSTGFLEETDFVATQFNRVVGGLNDSTISFDATGADLSSEFQDNVTLHLSGPPDGLYIANTNMLHLTIQPRTDRFFGSFEDPTTNSLHHFSGVLLPKSRTGAGIFFSHGLSGSVNISY